MELVCGTLFFHCFVLPSAPMKRANNFSMSHSEINCASVSMCRFNFSAQQNLVKGVCCVSSMNFFFLLLIPENSYALSFSSVCSKSEDERKKRNCLPMKRHVNFLIKLLSAWLVLFFAHSSIDLNVLVFVFIELQLDNHWTISHTRLPNKWCYLWVFVCNRKKTRRKGAHRTKGHTNFQQKRSFHSMNGCDIISRDLVVRWFGDGNSGLRVLSKLCGCILFPNFRNEREKHIIIGRLNGILQWHTESTESDWEREGGRERERAIEN